MGRGFSQKRMPWDTGSEYMGSMRGFQWFGVRMRDILINSHNVSVEGCFPVFLGDHGKRVQDLRARGVDLYLLANRCPPGFLLSNPGMLEFV